MHLRFCAEHRPGPGFWMARIIGLTVGGVAFAVVLAFLFGWLVQLLWNWLMPGLFDLKAITYWQAFGIVLLAKILFGHCGRNHAGRHHGNWRRHFRHWKDRNDWDDWSGDEIWKPHGSYRNWKYYDRYWREEGKAAFEAYIDKVEKDQKQS